MFYCKNFYYPQKFRNQAHNKSTNPKSYVLGTKVWLNNKYIKIKQNRKLEAKFFGFFQILYLVDKQAYKCKFSKK